VSVLLAYQTIDMLSISLSIETLLKISLDNDYDEISYENMYQNQID